MVYRIIYNYSSLEIIYLFKFLNTKPYYAGLYSSEVVSPLSLQVHEDSTQSILSLHKPQ
jgi:hypothetical protein